jgi:hypothetical protein
MLAGPERDQSKSKATDQADFEESAGSSGDEYTPAVNKDDGESEIDESDASIYFTAGRTCFQILENR